MWKGITLHVMFIVFEDAIVSSAHPQQSISNHFNVQDMPGSRIDSPSRVVRKRLLLGSTTSQANGILPQTTSLGPSCVSSFKQIYPTKCSGVQISSGPQQSSYVYSSIGILGNTFQSQRTWCTDYNQNIFFGQSYSESPVYGFEYVVANPQVAPDIDQPDRLNQVAFRMIRYELPKC